MNVVHGGVILFRGSGADARRYVEADRSRADDYYLGADATVATFTALDSSGAVSTSMKLDPADYAAWVDWTDLLTSESMGTPRLPGDGRRGSPRFAEMVVNTPKRLSIAAALHPDVSDVLDQAQQDAVEQIQGWLARHSVTRVGPRGRQEVVPIESLQTVAVVHRTSRAGDPHRHIHFQIGTRVWAAGKWRALDTAALFKQQGAIRALGTGVLAAHPVLAEVLDQHGLTLDPVTGEVRELEPFNTRMSKRGEQVRRNLDRLEAEWDATHPGESIGPVVSTRLHAEAWAFGRPAKKPTTRREEAAWISELRDAGYDPDTLTRQPTRRAVLLDDVSMQQVTSRALDRCAATACTWTRHAVQERATRIVTEMGVRAAPDELLRFIELATILALEDCFSVLPPTAPTLDHVAHLTSVRVVQTETELHDLLAARVSEREAQHPEVQHAADALRQKLGRDQLRAAAAVASNDPLVVVEGAAGAGKTTMLATAIHAVRVRGGSVRVLAPTKAAADVAHHELGVPAESVAALVHAHGWRWNSDGVWTRLAVADHDPGTGRVYRGPTPAAFVRRGERIVVDEVGMLDQQAAVALLTVADEAGATVALVGDRAQLAAVGRGGVLDKAAQLRGHTFDMAEVHRFEDSDYADLTVRMREDHDPEAVFDQLHRLGLIRLHASADAVREHIATSARNGETITVASNDEARWLNDQIRDQRIAQGLVDDTTTVIGNDGLPIGPGDLIQTRRNNPDSGVTNRQNWIVQHVEPNGSVWVREVRNDHQRQRSIALPAEYVAEHTHLAYASTAYGVQGATVPGSHTVLTDGLNGSAIYVGMTRGRTSNQLHVVAADIGDARAQFVEAMGRDRADYGLQQAIDQAAEAVAGLTADGPVKLVNTERGRLRELVEHTDRQAVRWERTAAALDGQQREHQVEADKQHAVLVSAEATTKHTCVEVVVPLIEQATTDGTDYLAARDRMWAASHAHRIARGLRKRSAARTLSLVSDEHHTIETVARRRWGSLPQTPDGIEPWAATVAQQKADADPRVTETRKQADEARQAQQRLTGQQMLEHADLRRQLFGNRTTRSAQPEAAAWRQQAEAARRDLAAIEALPVVEAARFIRERAEQEQQEATERALTERKVRAAKPHNYTRRPPDHGPAPPNRGPGL